jgi:hypothetical protein
MLNLAQVTQAADGFSDPLERRILAEVDECPQSKQISERVEDPRLS